MKLLRYRPPLIRLKSWWLGPKCASCPTCLRLAALGQIAEDDCFTDPETGVDWPIAPAHDGCDCGLETRTYDWTCLPK